jgi:Lysine methyltransferase
MHSKDSEEFGLDSIFPVRCYSRTLYLYLNVHITPRSLQVHLHRNLPPSSTLLVRVWGGRRSKSVLWDRIHYGDIICTPVSRPAPRLTINVDTSAKYSSSRWNASRAFASYLTSHPDLYRGRYVLELGAGGGLPGIVAGLDGVGMVCS